MSQHMIYSATDSGLNRFYAKVYGLVGMGIGLSAIVSAMMLYLFPENLFLIMSHYPWVYFGATILELVLVIFAGRVARQNSPLALPLYIVYSALNGFTLTFIIIRYAQTTVLAAFVSSALLFFIMALIGRLIKKDLSAFGKFLMAGLMGLILASIINLFLQASGMSFIISLLSVGIFSGLIAYENQLIKTVYDAHNGQVNDGWAISMALTLYLDFVNLFINLLSIFGRRD